jgi:ribosomal protein S18 acetylase RimI-like enzyme
VIHLRLLRPEEGDAAADVHRRALALIPGYDTSIHATGAFSIFYRETVMRSGPVWGAFSDAHLLGHIALSPGWIDHLYVDPDHHGQGMGSRLVKLAQAEQPELRLYTFQSNARARALYERHGFVLEALTSGDRNEEKMPDMTYHWRRT